MLIIQLIISILLVFFIFQIIRLDDLLLVLSGTDLALLGFGVLAYLALNVLNSFKLGLLVGQKMPFRELFMINMAGMLASDVTPGRAGYFYTIVLLKIRKSKSAAALAVFQLTELLVKLVGALAAFFLLLTFISGTSLPSYFFFAFGLIALAAVFIFLVSFSRHSEKLLGWSERFLPSFVRFQKHAKSTKKVFVSAFSVTLVGWFLRGLEWFFVANAIGLNLDFFQAVLLHPLITIFAFVPVSIAGLGLVEFAGITIITNMGVVSSENALETVLAFLLLDRAMNLVVDLIGLKRLVFR